MITRRNERRLGVSGTDWVKNGDRWAVTNVHTDGALSVRHTTSSLTVTLPAEYVAEHVELGYASTVHTAQGLTADAMHGIVTGQETRQLLYTMLTRGRSENHVHVVLAPAKDPHELALPGIVEQLTATEKLEGILARDGAAVSATTTILRGASIAEQLRDAVARYSDAIAVAARALPARGDEVSVGAGPLPWLPPVPGDVADDSPWGRYLAARARRVSSLAADVETAALEAPPAWAERHRSVLTDNLLTKVAIWRAATGLPDTDRRLLGPMPYDDDQAAYHSRLRRRINERYAAGVGEWEQRIVERVGRRDEHTMSLAQQLEQLDRRGADVAALLDRALAGRPLPDDHATAALAFRIRQQGRPTRRGMPIEPPRSMPSHDRPGIGF